MKKIYFGNGTNPHQPFWEPWGCLGCLGRFLAFLFLLSLLILLLSLFRKCSNTQTPLPDEFRRGSDAYEQPIGGNSDNIDDNGSASDADSNWNQPIPGGEDVGLPSPDDNNLPPFDQEEPIANPDDDGATQIYPNLLYVIFDSDENDECFKTFASKFTSLYPRPANKIEYYNTSSKTAVLSVPAENRTAICQKLPQQINEVKFLVVPVEVMTQNASVTPDDPVFRYPQLSWYFSPIQANEAWAITQGSPDVVVGIVDSYMDLSHEELSGGRAVNPYSVINRNSDVSPKRGTSMSSWGHGTFVTSVAVGNSGNGKGTSGIAPKCKFIPVSLGESLNTITMVEGLLYCIYHGADVINLSCGVAFSDAAKALSIDQQIAISKNKGVAQAKMWDYVFKIADERNVTIVWAAGNENIFSAMDTSKRNKNTIRVSAVDRNLKKAEFSNFGNFKDKGIFESTISAPGVDVFGALPNNSYDSWPGTSFSAPIVTGAVALMKSLNSNLTTSEIIKILQETGKPVDGAPEIGNLIQIKYALQKVKDQVPSYSSNINSLSGVWETTRALKIKDSNGNYTGEKGKIRIKIDNANSGSLIFITQGNKQFQSPATVSISSDAIVVKQTREATMAGEEQQFYKHMITIKADNAGKTKCFIKAEISDNSEEAYLRKIS